MSNRCICVTIYIQGPLKLQLKSNLTYLLFTIDKYSFNNFVLISEESKRLVENLFKAFKIK